MTRVASFVVLLAILAVIIVAFYHVMADFLLPIFIAAFLVVVFRPLHERIVDRVKGRKRLAALLTTTAVLLIVLLPTVAISGVALMEGVQLAGELRKSTSSNPLRRIRQAANVDMPAMSDFRAIETSFDNLNTLIRNRSSQEIIEDEVRRLITLLRHLKENPPKAGVAHELDATIAQVSGWPTPTKEEISLEDEVNDLHREFSTWRVKTLGGTYWAFITDFANPSPEQWKQLTSSAVSKTQPLLYRITSSTTSVIGGLLFGGMITIVAFYFFLCDGQSMVKTVMHLSPLDDRYEKELLDEFVGISRAVLLATILSAGAQALLAGIGYYFAGVEAVFLLMVITGVLALIPLVGTFGAWGPICCWIYFVEGRPVAAILLAIYCAAIVSTADNFIKPAVLHGQSRLHPLLALLSVLGGVKTLGPIGILVGPMVVVFLQTLLNILHRELVHFESGSPLAVLAGGAGGHATTPLSDSADGASHDDASRDDNGSVELPPPPSDDTSGESPNDEPQRDD